MDDLKISVLVAVYNVERYLPQCLRSILGQTYKKIEVIVVDDGSTDQSAAICDAYAAKDERVRVIHKQNGGLSSARNAGLEAASGDYLMFVDGDDYLAKDACAILVKALAKYPAEVISFGYDLVVNEEADLFPRHSSEPEYAYIYENVLCNHEKLAKDIVFLHNFCVMTWSRLYKKDLWQKLRFPVTGINNAEDVYTLYDSVRLANTIVCLKNRLYYYVQNPFSITHADVSMKKVIQDIIATEHMHEGIVKDCPSLREICAAKRYSQYKRALDLIYAGAACDAQEKDFLIGRLADLRNNRVLSLKRHFFCQMIYKEYFLYRMMRLVAIFAKKIFNKKHAIK